MKSRTTKPRSGRDARPVSGRPCRSHGQSSDCRRHRAPRAQNEDRHNLMTDDPPPRRDSAPGPQLFGHPRGLATLFLTEMWERFTYYGMRAILMLFLVGRRRRTAGSASTTRPAMPSTGSTSPARTCSSLFGGWIADRLDRRQRAVVVGRHAHHGRQRLLAIGHTQLFFFGLVVIVVRRRPAEAEHQRHRRAALSGRRLAARRRLLDLLHGHQPRRVPRLDARAARSRAAFGWQLGLRVRRRSCMLLGLVQFGFTRHYLGSGRRRAGRLAGRSRRAQWRGSLVIVITS